MIRALRPQIGRGWVQFRSTSKRRDLSARVLASRTFGADFRTCPSSTGAFHSLNVFLSVSAAYLHVIGNQKLRIAKYTVETETLTQDHTGASASFLVSQR